MGKIIVILGAPGAGKGTQARLLSERLGYPQISTGDILREMAGANTPLGREIKARQAAPDPHATVRAARAPEAALAAAGPSRYQADGASPTARPAFNGLSAVDDDDEVHVVVLPNADALSAARA